MKIICVLLFLILTVGQAQENFRPFSPEEGLKEIIFEEEDTDSAADYHLALMREGNLLRVGLYNLQKAKFKILNGDLHTARFLLNRINDRTSSGLTAVKKRYLAVINFIEGRHQESLELLSGPFMETIDGLQQTCLLKLINLMALDRSEQLRKESAQCMLQTEKFSKNEQFWLDTMIKLKTQDQTALKKKMITDIYQTISDDEMSRLWLKSGLYLNREQELLDLIGLLPESSYQSKRLREIVAFLYLREGNKEKALSFIDDIDSANAENIKGNFNLLNREYELAFGHFRLALQKKQDSANALERAIPLAWLLKQWDDGINMLNSTSNKGLDPRNKKAIEIAFMIRQKKFLEAQKELTLLKIAFQNEPPFEVNIMDTYVNLVLEPQEKKFDKRKIEESAEKSCKSFDGISCWIALQYLQWDNLGKSITRDELTYADKAMSVEGLKEKVPVIPLKESVNIDQSDIEELDSASVVLPN